MLPLLFFFYTALNRIWRKIAFASVLTVVSYAIAAWLLNAARIIPLVLTDGGYNYVLSLSITGLTMMLAMQPASKNQFAVPARIYLALWTIWGISAAVRLLVINMPVQVNVEYRLIYSFTLLTLTFFGIYIYAGRIKTLEKNEFIINMKAENLLHNYDRITNHLKEVNSLKHDMKNHMTALNILLKGHRYTEAEEYLKKYADEVGEVTEAMYHQNYLINTVAHDLVNKSKVMGFKAELNLNANVNSMSEPDLISLLSNITDNALEACEKIPNERNRFIKLTLTRRNPYLAIICENSNPGDMIINTDNESNNIFLSGKNDIEHGYGLQNIKKIAASYDGMTDIHYDDKTFTITVALKDIESEAQHV